MKNLEVHATIRMFPYGRRVLIDSAKILLAVEADFDDYTYARE